MADQYTLRFINNSTMSGNACVYQTDPNIGPNVMSLAWFSKAAHPTTKLTFRWTIDYSFTWAETGQLIPGVFYDATQNWPADLQNTNQVTFSRIGGAYTFKDQVKGAIPGTLYIMEDSTIPSKMASVGVGMSGNGTFAVQAQPNITAMFTPHPQYWITFGMMEEGEVLDIAQITQKANIEFPPGIFSMTAILKADNTWDVKPTNEVNRLFVKSRMENREIIYGNHL